MKKLMKTFLVGSLILAFGATTVAALASSAYKSPAEALAELTGKTAEEVIAEKTESGDTYGAIAAEAGVLEEFRQARLEMKKNVLEERVADGTLTQERADEIISAMEERAENCDGTGTGACGMGLGGMFGRVGSGMGNGKGAGFGARNGQHGGFGIGRTN